MLAFRAKISDANYRACIKHSQNEMPSKRSKSKSKKDSEEPEICLFQVPVFKPKNYKMKAELKDLKKDKTMDIKVFDNGIQFFPQGKKQPKRTIEYNTLDDVQQVDDSPELIRLFTKSKGKKTCYQINVTDEVNRKKLCEYLEGKTTRSKRRNTPPGIEDSTMADDMATYDTDKKRQEETLKEETQKTYEDPPIKNSNLAPSEYSKNQTSNTSHNYGDNTEAGYGNKNPKQRSIIRNGGMMGRDSEVPFDRKSRSTTFNTDDADDDFNSVSDQQTRGIRNGYPARRPETSHYSRSRFSEEPEYIDDDYQEDVSSGYGYDYSEYSEETVVVRPVKPRSLTFYTPFLKVPQSRLPYYS